MASHQDDAKRETIIKQIYAAVSREYPDSAKVVLCAVSISVQFDDRGLTVEINEKLMPIDQFPVER